MDSPLNDSQLLSLIKDYTERLKHEPDADVFCQLAHSYVRLGLIDPAVTAVQQGLTHNPQHLNGQLLLAELLGENEQYDEAMAYYDRVLKQYPDCVDALIGAARLDINQSNLDRAKFNLDKARLLQPDHPALRDLALQINDSVGVVELDANLPLVTATVAELYFKQGLTEKAVEVYKTLVRQQPHNEVLQARLNVLLDQVGLKSCTECGKLVEKLESWLAAIQRRRKNV